MWSVGGLQVQGIRSRRLVYKEMVEVQSSYKKILLLVMLIASANSRSVREASHQPAFMGSCLTISHMW